MWGRTMKKSPKLARLGRPILAFSASAHRILNRESIPLSRFIPKTLGGDKYNIWNKWVCAMIGSHQSILDFVVLPMDRKPLWDYAETHRCDNVLEIGLGSGRNMRKMLELLGDGCDYYCFDNLVCSDGKQTYDRLKNRKNIHFYIGDTRETIPRYADKLPKMDLIFIDGGHDYDVVKSDWENCKKLMHCKTAVFFHDYDVEGVKRVVDGISDGFSVKIIPSRVGSYFALVRRSANG